MEVDLESVCLDFTQLAFYWSPFLMISNWL
jgi:hypothetical protein